MINYLLVIKLSYILYFYLIKFKNYYNVKGPFTIILSHVVKP